MEEKSINQIEKRLDNIERLLRTLPEMLAAVYLVESEKANIIHFAGKKYSDCVDIPPPAKR